MRCILGLAGAVIILYAVLDLLWTTFLEGGAPLTTQACHRLAKLLLGMHKRGRRRRWVASIGLVVVVCSVATWVLLMWVGWALVFSAADFAVVSGEMAAPATTWERIYFAGSTLITLGLGDFRPEGHFWQIITVIAAGSGFLLVGTALAYLVPVSSAATQKRQVALCIAVLGGDPAEIIARAWNGVDSTALSPHLISLTEMLALLGENHVTYPVLHYFHSSKRSSAIGPNVAALDEAITILECGLQKGCSLDLPSLGAARQAITAFLETLRPALVYPAREAPPSPSLQSLRDMGVPVVDDELFRSAVVQLTERRKQLLALVGHEGWDWDVVWPAGRGAAAAHPGAAVASRR